jgi:H/ACA ribonucleoprotein complex subunit 4
MQLHEDVPEQKIRDVFAEFTGEIFQRPPLRASVKRSVRKRTIYSLDILEVDGRRVLFKIACQAGTYVRKICSDIGEVLGCGAHMSELRRTRAGPFHEERNLCSMYDLLNAYESYKTDGQEEKLRTIVRPMEEAFEFIPKIYVRDSAVDAICHGADLAIPGIVKLDLGIKANASIVLVTLKGEVIALAKALMSSEQMLDQDRGIAAKTVRVIMPPGTYPPLWRQS